MIPAFFALEYIDEFYQAKVTEVHEFKKWYLSKPRSLSPISNGVKTMPMLGHDETKTAMDAVIFRRDRFQVQLFCFPAFSIIPEHLHPNVRSYEIYLGGEIAFSKDKKWNMILPEELKPWESHSECYISEHSWHGGLVGSTGAMFLSIQEWINGVNPSCVGNDWEGIACVEDHKIESETLSVEFNGSFSWKLAAGKETRPPNFWKKIKK